MHIVSAQHSTVSGGVVWSGALRGGRRQEADGWGRPSLRSSSSVVSLSLVSPIT